MPRSASTGVYTRVSNSFSNPVAGTVIDDAAAILLFNDQDDTGFNNLPVKILDRSVTNPTYGAKGDGTTNDTAAVQAALTALTGGVVYFPAGTYSIAHIDMVANVKLLGDGPGKTILKCRSAPSAGTDWIYGTGLSNIEIEGITFDGNGNLTNLASGHVANVVPCVYLVGGSNVYVHDCEFKGWDTCGFSTNTTDTVTVCNNLVTRSSGSAGYLATPDGSGTDGAINAASASFTSLTANFQVADEGKIIRIVGAGTGGIPLVTTILTRNSATNVTLSINAGTSVTGATYQYGGTAVGNYGIFLSGTGTVDADNLANFVVDGNIVTNSSIAISGHDGVVTNNIVSGFGFGAGIHTQGLASNYNVRIDSNTCFNGLGSQDTAGAYPGGIENWAPGGSVSNNTCYGCWGPGISNAAKAVYGNNVCYNNGQSGVSGSAGISSFYQDATFNGNGSLIVGNKCYDNQTPKTQQYGYFENAALVGVGSDINLIGNDFGDNLTANVLLRTMSRASNMASTVTIDAGGFSGGTFDNASVTGANPLTLKNFGTGAFNLQIKPNTTMTNNRIWTIAADADVTFTMAGAASLTFPALTDTVVTLTSTGALTNKTSYGILNNTHQAIIASTGTITADRTLSINTNDTSPTFFINGNLTVNTTFVTPTFSTTLNAIATTSITLPFTGSIAATIATSGTTSSHTGDTTETTLATITLPANTMGANGSVAIIVLMSYTGTAGTHQTRIKFGGTTYYDSTAVAGANYLGGCHRVQIWNKNATNSQAGGSYVNASSSTIAPTTSAVDTTANVSILITTQLGNAGDTGTLEGYVVQVFR